MPVHNEEIARAFEEMADLLALRGENPFRVRAYQRAAMTVRGSQRELHDRLQQCQRTGADPLRSLDELPGIGKDLAGKIIELLSTGRCKALEQLRRKVPAGLPELLRVPGLGPRRVQALYGELKVHDRQQLERALREGAVAKLRGFGPRLQARLARELQVSPPEERRWLRSVAAGFATPLLAHLRAVPGVTDVVIAGSYRRGRDTVGDLDLLVSATDPAAVVAALRHYDGITAWKAQGPKRETVTLRSGMQVDLRISEPGAYGAALHYFTGSKAHNIHLRRMASEQGLKINEYGVFRGRTRVAGATETEVFRSVGLPWIPVEMREDRGEIELARTGQLPQLVTRADLRGDLHAHTRSTDGQQGLEQMARAAQAAGLSFLAITDHSRHLGLVHGLDAKRLQQQMEAIDRLNEKLKGLTLLKGIEVDIFEDGRLALPDALLARLDVVVAAVHSHFDLGEQQQTRRILRAMEHPAFSILAHPTGRLLGERAPMRLDMARICAAAKARPCYLELNSQPQRLDLDDVHCRLAREHGVLVSIASDAHHGSQFACLDEGIVQARRGWLRAGDVLNTRPLAELRRLLRATFL